MKMTGFNLLSISINKGSRTGLEPWTSRFQSTLSTIPQDRSKSKMCSSKNGSIYR